MPTYENRCRRCGHLFENVQSIKDETRPACPVCGGETERLISLGSFVLKGTGWAKQGYSRTTRTGK